MFLCKFLFDNYISLQLIGGDLDGAKKERQVIRSKIKQLDDGVKALDKDIQSLQEELGAVTEKRDKAYENIQQLRKQRDQGVCLTCFDIHSNILFYIP